MGRGTEGRGQRVGGACVGGPFTGGGQAEPSPPGRTSTTGRYHSPPHRPSQYKILFTKDAKELERLKARAEAKRLAKLKHAEALAAYVGGGGVGGGG